MQTLTATSPVSDSPLSQGAPFPPATVEETGLPAELLLQLLVKTLFSAGELTESTAGDQLKLPFPVLKELFLILQREKLVEVKGYGEPLGLMYRYILTDSGRQRAQSYMEVNRYVGPAPVPLSQYEAVVRKQPVSSLCIGRETVMQATNHLTLAPHAIDQLGEAVNSGWAIFLYGPPGNGKTVVAEAIGQMLKLVGGGDIYVPYAVEVDGQILQVFDPVTHRAIDQELSSSQISIQTKSERDSRWVLCKRPIEFTGGELTLAMLDLTYNPTAKFYKAPPHVKANGGVFIIDDFGRQLVRPRDLLNRWIVPLEKRVDFLTLHTGKVFPIPFDTIVIFATNIEPQKLADEAFLRRIRNKIFINDPSQEAYAKILESVCSQKHVAYDPEAVEYLYQYVYKRHNLNARSCHPRDLVEQVVSIAKYNGIPPSLDRDLLDRACQTYFFIDDSLKDQTVSAGSREASPW